MGRSKRPHQFWEHKHRRSKFRTVRSNRQRMARDQSRSSHRYRRIAQWRRSNWRLLPGIEPHRGSHHRHHHRQPTGRRPQPRRNHPRSSYPPRSRDRCSNHRPVGRVHRSHRRHRRYQYSQAYRHPVRRRESGESLQQRQHLRHRAAP